MKRQHACAIPGCTAQVPAGILMCKPHWFAVPGALRRRVNAAWRAVVAARAPGTAANVDEIVTTYRNAVADAVAAVQSALP